MEREKEKMTYILLMALTLPLAGHDLVADLDCPQKTAELAASFNTANLTTGRDEEISCEAINFCEEVIV
jgi:hypothetical protein